MLSTIYYTTVLLYCVALAVWGSEFAEWCIWQWSVCFLQMLLVKSADVPLLTYSLSLEVCKLIHANIFSVSLCRFLLYYLFSWRHFRVNIFFHEMTNILFVICIKCMFLFFRSYCCTDLFVVAFLCWCVVKKLLTHSLCIMCDDLHQMCICCLVMACHILYGRP